MSEHFELEAKYESSQASCKRLRLILSLHGFALHLVNTFSQSDTYFDTAGMDLRNQSASLRRRVSSKQIILTYKGPRQREGRNTHIVKRREEEQRLDGTELENWEPGHQIADELMPEPLRIVREIVDLNQLRPQAEVETVRENRIFVAANGSVIEIAIDRSTGVRVSDSRVVSINEIEVEAKNVDEQVFNRFIAELEREVPDLLPGGPSKLNRTLN